MWNTTFRDATRAVLPARTRAALRRWISDTPHRVEDFFPDLMDAVSQRPLPPPRLRGRVGLNSSRKEYLSIGRDICRDLLAALVSTGFEPLAYATWLDFGCGPGRVAMHLADCLPTQEIIGVDVDRKAIDWCRRHLPGKYEVIQPHPPIPLERESVDVVYSVSVFTHMSETRQLEWLEEIARLLRPNGLLIASTCSPELTYGRPDLTNDQHRMLGETGFLFAPAFPWSSFNEDSAFHSRDYLQRTWGRLFQPLSYQPRGLTGYQDLSVWRKPDAEPRAGPRDS